MFSLCGQQKGNTNIIIIRRAGGVTVLLFTLTMGNRRLVWFYSFDLICAWVHGRK